MRGVSRSPALAGVVFAALASVARLGWAAKLEQHTFQPPYSAVDPSGRKIVSREWKSGGVATVNSNFIRLTPDRQSKKGALWSRKSLGTDNFSMTLKFRISGQGKKFFGDGMALWVMQQAYYVEGDFHGSVERFTGFGVIFDTFKNTETLSYHRDVSLVYNDGEKTTEVMLENKEGCDASIRYHEERGDFSVESASRAKVIVENGRQITVLVDPSNDGTFTRCIQAELPLDQNWARQAHVGVSASTGQLADNHDVLELVTFDNAAEHDEHEALQLSTPKFTRGEGMTEDRFHRLEDVLNSLLQKLEVLEHHVEHELVAVEDHIKVAVGKIQAQEAISEGRIDELEKKVVDNVRGDLNQRIGQLESSIDESIGHRINSVENVLNTRISETVADSAQGDGGWKLPFLFLFCCMIAAAVGLYLWYKQLKKTHML